MGDLLLMRKRLLELKYWMADDEFFQIWVMLRKKIFTSKNRLRHMTSFEKCMDDRSTIQLLLTRADRDISFSLEKFSFIQQYILICSMPFVQDCWIWISLILNQPILSFSDVKFDLHDFFSCFYSSLFLSWFRCVIALDSLNVMNWFIGLYREVHDSANGFTKGFTCREASNTFWWIS